MFCSYCGASVGQNSWCRNCGAYRIGSNWIRTPGAAPVSAAPTAVVPLGRQSVPQPPGGRYPGPPPLGPPPHPRSRRGWLVATLIVIVLALAGGGVATAVVLRHKQSADDKYLAALKQAGLAGQFPSDASAIAHGKKTCRTLEEGGAPQGMPVDKIAVDTYCPKFAKGFKVLETATVSGTFTLIEESPSSYYPSITTTGSNCEGADGFGDIHEGTEVVVKNGSGVVLVTTTMGAGTGTSRKCVFPFSFQITEGEDRYIVSVTDRGEFTYTFADLKNGGVSLALGGR